MQPSATAHPLKVFLFLQAVDDLLVPVPDPMPDRNAPVHDRLVIFQDIVFRFLFCSSACLLFHPLRLFSRLRFFARAAVPPRYAALQVFDTLRARPPGEIVNKQDPQILFFLSAHLARAAPNC